MQHGRKSGNREKRGIKLMEDFRSQERKFVLDIGMYWMPVKVYSLSDEKGT